MMFVDDEGRLTGIIAERDLIYAVAEGKTCGKMPVWGMMTENSIIASPQDPITDALRKTRNAHVRHLPVIDKEGKPVGMISMRDIADTLILVLGLVGSL